MPKFGDILKEIRNISDFGISQIAQFAKRYKEKYGDNPSRSHANHPAANYLLSYNDFLNEQSTPQECLLFFSSVLMKEKISYQGNRYGWFVTKLVDLFNKASGSNIKTTEYVAAPHTVVAMPSLKIAKSPVALYQEMRNVIFSKFANDNKLRALEDSLTSLEDSKRVSPRKSHHRASAEFFKPQQSQSPSEQELMAKETGNNHKSVNEPVEMISTNKYNHS